MLHLRFLPLVVLKLLLAMMKDVMDEIEKCNNIKKNGILQH